MSDVLAFEAIGTTWKIDLREELPPERRAALLHSVTRRIESFDRAYSRFRSDSLVTEMSARAGTYRLPDDAWPMIELYERLYRLTDGAFTPLIGRTLEEAGYDAAYSLVPGALHAPPPWHEVIECARPSLVLKRPALLDFGAGGKGYLADLVADALADAGVRAFCIDAGGDIVCRNAPTRVGLEDPNDFTRAIGVAALETGSVCGSAGSRRAWAGFHHIIDPRNLTSPRHVLATWVFAESGLVADALATCLYFVEPERLREAGPFEYVVLFADRRATCSPGAPVELFSS